MSDLEAIKKELADMHATAHRDTDRRGKKLADLHSDIEHVHKTASSGGDISNLAALEDMRHSGTNVNKWGRTLGVYLKLSVYAYQIVSLNHKQI